MPGFVLEYLKRGAEDEATLARGFCRLAVHAAPTGQLWWPNAGGADSAQNTPMPLAIAPTGLNGLFRRYGDMMLAQGAAKVGIPFTQSTM